MLQEQLLQDHMLQEHALEAFIIWSNILSYICSSSIFEWQMLQEHIANMLQKHIWMHNPSGAYRKYAPGAVFIQIMLLEHIGLRILQQIINAPGACSWSRCSWSIVSGKNLTKRPPQSFSVTRPFVATPLWFSILNALYPCFYYTCIAICLRFPLMPKEVQLYFVWRSYNTSSKYGNILNMH